jgi:hypothetical protein
VNRTAFALLFAVTLGCGGASRTPAAAGSSDENERASRAFPALEDEILRDLAALDQRIARRARLTPSEDDLRRVTMAAVLHEDPSLAVVDGGIDPFSFDARARGIASAKHKVAALPNDGGRPSERELITDLVDAESVRLDEERALPRSASSLVRAIIESWQPPKGERELAEADRWLTRRLGTVREALMNPSDPSVALDVVRARELDDALDGIEHITAAPGFTTATQELVRVREALESASSRPAAKAHSDWSRTALRMRAHLGVDLPAEQLASELVALESKLRVRAEGALTELGAGKRDAFAALIDKEVSVGGPCSDDVPRSRVRSMAAPPEREPSCHLRHLVARTPSGQDALWLAVMHDHVVIAQWALDVARGATTIAAAQSAHRLLLPASPSDLARHERAALARPVAAIGAGLTARILATEPHERAAKWSTLGDVPLDVAMRELGSK